MALVPFSPPPGVNADDTSFSVPSWSDADNVRFRLGRPETIGKLAATGVAIPSGAACRAAFFWAAADAGAWGAYGTATKLYAWDGALLTDISPTPAPAAPNAVWSFNTWGSSLLACPVGGKLYQWNLNTATPAAVVTNAPTSIGWMLVTPQRQVLAFGCNEEVSGTFNFRCIRGCDYEDNTDWTTTATNGAFEEILPGDSGYIVTARMVGPYLAVWTTTALFMGQFIGDPSQIWRFEKVADGCGMWGGTTAALPPATLLGQPRAATVAGMTAYWMGADENFWRWTPGTLPEVIQCPIATQVRARHDADGTKGADHACFLPKTEEVWFHYNYGALNQMQAVFLNIRDGTWSRSSLQRNTMVLDPLGVEAPYVRAVDTTGTEYFHEYSSSGSTPAWSITSGDQFLEDSQRRMMVRKILPDFLNQSGDVSLTLYARDRPQSSEVTKGPYTLTTATTKKDFRASGKIFRVKFSGASGTSARLGKHLFDIVPMGER